MGGWVETLRPIHAKSARSWWLELRGAGGLAVAAAIGGATLATPAYADDVYGHCTTDGVRIRSNPSTSGTVLGLCYTGERLAHRDVSGDGQWDLVYDVDSGVSGWMSHGYYSW